jgi:hypothetical protein
MLIWRNLELLSLYRLMAAIPQENRPTSGPGPDGPDRGGPSLMTSPSDLASLRPPANAAEFNADQPIDRLHARREFVPSWFRMVVETRNG